MQRARNIYVFRAVSSPGGLSPAYTELLCLGTVFEQENLPEEFSQTRGLVLCLLVVNGYCAGTYYSVQPENSVIRVQGCLKPTFAHTGKFGQILRYTCDVVRMVHG